MSREGARLGDGDGRDVAREEEAGCAALALRRAAELGQRAAARHRVDDQRACPG